MTKIRKLNEKIEYIAESLHSIKVSLNERGKMETNVENLNLDSAIQFLNAGGYPISKSTMYKLTSKSEIPFHRFGNRLVFKIKDLRDWCSSKTHSNEKDETCITAVAISAQAKLTA